MDTGQAVDQQETAGAVAVEEQHGGPRLEGAEGVQPLRIFTGTPGSNFVATPVSFEPLASAGRSEVEIHSLYSSSETGPDGPAAGIVRYLPGATAAPHVHQGFELIFVLSGELETDDGVYPANSLLVMRPGTVHAPRSPRGCVGLAVWEQPVRPV